MYNISYKLIKEFVILVWSPLKHELLQVLEQKLSVFQMNFVVSFDIWKAISTTEQHS